MGYIDFETDNAIYRLHIAAHGNLSEDHSWTIDAEDIRDNSNAFVMELSGMILESGAITGLTAEAVDFSLETVTSAKAIEIAVKKQTPVFFPDIAPVPRVNTWLMDSAALPLECALTFGGLIAGRQFLRKFANEQMSRRRFLISAGSAVIAFFIGAVGLSSGPLIIIPGEISKRRPFQLYKEIAHRLFKSAIVEGRNAVNAEKIEGFIAPLISKRLGKKPILQLFYGSEHAGIEHCLKDATYRREVMKSFSPPEEFYYPENLCDCFEATFSDPKVTWRANIVQHTNIIEFPQMTEKELGEVRAKAMELEARINKKQIRRESNPMDRRGFLKMLVGRG